MGSSDPDNDPVKDAEDMGSELKPKWEAPKVPAGQVRPDVKHDAEQRQTDFALRRGPSVQQARASEIPMKGETPARTAQPPPVVPATRPAVSERAPVTGRPDAGGHETAGLPPHHTPDTGAMEQAVQAGKRAFNALSKLAQGGAQKRPQPVKTTATPQDALRHALIARRTVGPKTSTQPGKDTTAVSTRETSQPAVGKDAEGRVRQPGERIIAEKVAEASAPKSPFVEKRGIKEDIKTDRRAAERLGSVTEGVARGIVAASGTQEFSGGGYQGGFGDPNGESAGLAGTVGAVPQIPVYGEDANYVETHVLCSSLGLTKVLYDQTELRERVRVGIGDRIFNTRDDVPLSERMGDARYLQQAAFGSRGSVYGPGKMVG